jgi:uncharacterized membrane protein
MGKRRNSDPPPDGVVPLPVRRAESVLRVAAGTLLFPVSARAPTPARRGLAMEGPLPLPETMREYDEMVPGLALRIVEWAEHEAEHRRRMERSLLRLSWGGLWCALAVALTAIVGGMVLAWGGRSTAGLIGIVTAVAGLVIVFVAGRKRLPADATPQGAGAPPPARRSTEPPA